MNWNQAAESVVVKSAEAGEKKPKNFQLGRQEGTEASYLLYQRILLLNVVSKQEKSFHTSIKFKIFEEFYTISQ